MTSVGGTQGLSGDETAFEPVYGIGGGSGGFSDYFSQPWHQALAVNKYLSKYISAKMQKYYDPFVNFQGRGFPDVAAHAFGPAYNVVIQGNVIEYVQAVLYVLLSAKIRWVHLCEDTLLIRMSP